MPRRTQPSARARRGDGTVKQRTDSTWWVFRSATKNGQRRRWWDGPFATEKDARTGRHLAVPDAKTDAGVWLTEWAEKHCARLRLIGRHANAKLIDSHVRIHLAPQLTGTAIGAITDHTLDDLWWTLRATPTIRQAGHALPPGQNEVVHDLSRLLAPKTVANIRGTLSLALQAAVKSKVLDHNPMHMSSLPQVPQGERQGIAPHAQMVLDDAQARTLARWCLDHLLTERFALPTLLALDCGLRRGEVLAAKTTLIDLGKQRLRVETQISEQDGTLRDRPPKTATAVRWVPLPDRTVEAIRRHVRSQTVVPLSNLAQYLFFNPHAPAGQPPVHRPDGWTQWVSQTLRRDEALVSLPERWSLHWLRHTYATRQLDHGMPLKHLSEILGHANVVITAAVYVHKVCEVDEATVRQANIAVAD